MKAKRPGLELRCGELVDGRGARGRGRGELPVPEGVCGRVREGRESSALECPASEGLAGAPSWEQVWQCAS